MRRGDLGQRDDFVGLRERARKIDEAGAQTDGAVLHRFIDECTHPVELGLGGRPGETATHDLAAHGIVANERGDVEGGMKAAEGAFDDLVDRYNYMADGYEEGDR